MESGILKLDKLEQVLQSHWAEFLDNAQVLRVVLHTISNTEFKIVVQDEIPPKHTKLTASSCRYLCDGDYQIAIEYTAPKNNGVVIGTVVCCFNLEGQFWITETYGTHFVPKT
jgi:hypothetical protein